MIYNLTDDVFTATGALAGKTPVKLRQYDNRLWAVCDDGSIVFSDNGDAATWDALNIILLPNREAALDFLPVQGGVIIPHRNGAYALYGSGTYQDTSILPIQNAANDPVTLTDSAVVVTNTAYILSDRGIYAVSLNGLQEIPHNQDSFFAANYPLWKSQNQVIQGVYLQKFHSILYLFHASYGSLGVMFNVKAGAFQKINQTLAAAMPYMTDLADQDLDFILGSGDGTIICKSVYPPARLTHSRESVIQTRHEDADSLRDKIWRELIVTTAEPVYNVTISAYLDRSEDAITLVNTDLTAGENRIPLFNGDGVLRSHEISVEIRISSVVGALTDAEYLADGDDFLSDEGETYSDPANFTIKALALRYREAGPMV